MNHNIDIDERWKAILSAVVIIIVNAFALIGIDVGDGADLQDAILAIAWIASLAWAIWKNHNFTDEAAKAQKYLDELKAERKAKKCE